MPEISPGRHSLPVSTNGVPGCWYQQLVSAAGVTFSGSATDVWIFQIGQNLDLASGAIVTLSGGAVAKNIFWQVAGQATLGTTASMKGIILCQTAVVMNTGASLEGRALAQSAVTLIANNVNSPVPVRSIATVTSIEYTVSAGGTSDETITNVPSGTAKAVFLAALMNGQVNQTWNSADMADPVIAGDELIVTSQDKITTVTYTVTVNP